MDRNPAVSSAGEGDALDLSVLGSPRGVATVNMKHSPRVRWRTVLDESCCPSVASRVGAQRWEVVPGLHCSRSDAPPAMEMQRVGSTGFEPARHDSHGVAPIGGSHGDRDVRIGCFVASDARLTRGWLFIAAGEQEHEDKCGGRESAA